MTLVVLIQRWLRGPKLPQLLLLAVCLLAALYALYPHSATGVRCEGSGCVSRQLVNEKFRIYSDQEMAELAETGSREGTRLLFFQEKKRKLPKDIDAENIAGGVWPSGRLFIDLRWKMRKGASGHVDSPFDVMLYMGHSGQAYLPLKRRILSLGDDVWHYENQKGNAFLAGRTSYMDKFKPGVNDLRFIFTDTSATYVYRFPWYELWRDVLDPLIELAVGPGMIDYVGRLQMARISNGAKINPHVDSGGWPLRLHRIHVPIQVSDGTVFEAQDKHGNWLQIPVIEGSMFELNNKVTHRVDNFAELPRIHLIIDVAEEPFQDVRYMKPDQTCTNKNGDIVCDD